ncbi:hypothetical protein EDB80DRAFT_650669 [Ilyonectria destructans]|nr:hypothetical protein EDB80DRAFT_650669 [Ilyonectria destructans]
MRDADQKADVFGPSWEEDTIYCEATCAPEDVFYEGSDDEDYDDPTSRRLRYEAAGQRFLDGSTPLLLTATLKGPFDRSSGWTNPWRSKHRTAGTTLGTRTSPEKPSRQSKHQRNVSIPETIQVGPQDSMECHLPSPESLKQAPVADIHPYLEEEELAMVQNWRTAVQPVAKDGFWAVTPTGNRSERKRKARGSEWLRKLVSKRRRTELMESGSIDTPIPRRAGFHEEDSGIHLGLNTSFSSVPDRLPSSATASTRFLRRHDGKRFSPNRNRKRAAYETKESEDELSLDKAAMKAAATLSSPVSQQRFSQVLPQKSPRHTLSQRVLAKQSPNPPTSSLTSMMSEDFGEESVQFETQRDESFCFRMPSKTTNTDEIDQNDVMETESWSGLSSSDDTKVEPLSVADDCLESKVQSPRINSPSVPPDSGAMEINKDEVSSELSSLVSEDFAGFDVDASGADAEMASDSDALKASDTASVSDTASEPTSEARDAIAKDVANEQHLFQDVSNEQPYEIQATEIQGQSMSQDDISDDGSEEQEEESDDGTNNDVPSQVSFSQVSEHEASEQEILDSVPSRQVKPLQSGPLRLLKDSVKRFVPKTSWAMLSSLTGPVSSPAPTTETEPNESSHKSITSTPRSQASSPMSEPSERQTTFVQNDQMEVDNASQEATPLPVSQQSPWTEARLSQMALLPANHVVQDLDTPQKIDDASTIASTPVQTPWAISAKLPGVPQDHTPSIDNSDRLSALHRLATTSSSSQMQNHSTTSVTPAITPAIGLRATTPEPQFSVKSFASFMSPSPERRPRNSKRASWRDSGSRLPSTQGILASATKNPWDVDMSQRRASRISWAPLPHETSSPTTGDAMPSSLEEAKVRQTSPPPPTPIAELPAHEDDRFGKHFAAVVCRTKGGQKRLLPSASQRTLNSPEVHAMAETFLAVDQLRNPGVEGQSPDPAGSQCQSERIQESQEPLDIVEDVIREMGGYLDTWNVDMELDQARKASNMQMPQLAQSPW